MKATLNFVCGTTVGADGVYIHIGLKRGKTWMVLSQRITRLVINKESVNNVNNVSSARTCQELKKRSDL